MIPPDTMLHIYEIRGEMVDISVPDPPPSFIGIWNEEDFSYLFFTESEDDYIRARVCGNSLSSWSRHEMKYSDWQTGLPSNGLSIGGFRFVPADDPAPESDSLLLDPSVVFGDGSHPTTTSCLKFLQQVIEFGRIESMLDLGTGTGILALAAARLGVSRILAVDRNRLAAETARKNVRINKLESIIQVEESEARLHIDRTVDLVTANLPFQVLRDLVTLRGANLHRFWIVSGIDRIQAGVLKELLTEQGYSIGNESIDAPWVTFEASKQM
ncbi:MAG: 50S ribosomal protein L11 methyltransferase [Desulfomonile tiedjei]|uniref:50S ribosomal protein L11 methyltransferase n=1 Tax=Desulfomonile tiedjei TaxID=2358 RepID=A0A9D6V1M4_9BACT|nr:50S ribosomal protein L11 methyltransferase [Desulfomonile tiedjei]